MKTTTLIRIRSLLPRSCRIYASAGAGFDWVDTRKLAERGVIYCNSAPACTESVADTAIWLILNSFRNFTWSSSAARSLDPKKFTEAHQNIAATTHNPNGFTLGVIGLGRIGYRIAQKARVAFEMQVIYNDIARLPADVEGGVGAKYYQLGDLLAEADCVLLATPFVGEKLMNAERFAMMKRGSRFVNIARGKLVDEASLVAALESGHLSYAGLDVHYNEPYVNPDLAKMPQVELLSHTAGASLESHIGFERIGIVNILSFFETDKAITPVNLQWLTRSKL
jgi:lactate dehydrogenase-like 2-hydroxyacid dehydrogenase